jgi:hypothetical protein
MYLCIIHRGMIHNSETVKTAQVYQLLEYYSSTKRNEVLIHVTCAK